MSLEGKLEFMSGAISHKNAMGIPPITSETPLTKSLNASIGRRKDPIQTTCARNAPNAKPLPKKVTDYFAPLPPPQRKTAVPLCSLC